MNCLNTVTYALVEERYPLNDTVRTAYGIVAYANNDTSEAPSIITSVRDVTGDKEAVCALIEKCNRLALSPLHLMDVVEDFLSI